MNEEYKELLRNCLEIGQDDYDNMDGELKVKLALAKLKTISNDLAIDWFNEFLCDNKEAVNHLKNDKLEGVFFYWYLFLTAYARDDIQLDLENERDEKSREVPEKYFDDLSRTRDIKATLKNIFGYDS